MRESVVIIGDNDPLGHQVANSVMGLQGMNFPETRVRRESLSSQASDGAGVFDVSKLYGDRGVNRLRVAPADPEAVRQLVAQGVQDAAVVVIAVGKRDGLRPLLEPLAVLEPGSLQRQVIVVGPDEVPPQHARIARKMTHARLMRTIKDLQLQPLPAEEDV